METSLVLDIKLDWANRAVTALHSDSPVSLSNMKRRSLIGVAGEPSAPPLPLPNLQQGIQVLQDFGFRLNAFQSRPPDPVPALPHSHVRRETMHVSDLWSQRHRKSFLVVSGLEEAQNVRIRQARLQPLSKQASASDSRLPRAGSTSYRHSPPGNLTSRAAHTSCHSLPWTHSNRKPARGQKMNLILSKLEDTVEATAASRKSLSLLYSDFQRLQQRLGRKLSN